jgi:predicted transposase/invertase (TIGR01784 family)
MANHYDRIFKENIEPLIPVIARKIFGLKINQTEDIKDKLQYTLEKEADYLQKVIHPDPENDYILHVECQVKDDTEMLSRMLLYRAIVYHLFKLPVKQYVFFIGEKTSKMNIFLAQDDLTYSFHLRDIHQFSYKNFIDSNIPEEVVLAILADFEGINPTKIIEEIVRRLQQISDKSLRLSKYEKQLEILSKLRKLQKETIQTITQMGWEYELETDIRYLQGIDKGKEQGIEQGIEITKQEANLRFVTFLLSSTKFTIEEIAKLADVTTEFVEKVKRELQ